MYQIYLRSSSKVAEAFLRNATRVLQVGLLIYRRSPLLRFPFRCITGSNLCGKSMLKFPSHIGIMYIVHEFSSMEWLPRPRSKLLSTAAEHPIIYETKRRLTINPLKTKRRLLYLKTQFVPRSKHFSSRL